MKKLYTLIVMAFIAVAVNAQIANKKIAISPLNDISVKGNRSLSNIRIPENAVKVTPLKKAPKKAISSVGDLAGEYEWTYYTTEEDPAADPSTIEKQNNINAFFYTLLLQKQIVKYKCKNKRKMRKIYERFF